jgi:hypothetical protein
MASGFGETRCPPSAIPGIGTGRIRGEAILAAGTRALRRTVDSESPRATDTPPGTPGRPPPRRTAAGILGDWSGTVGAAQPYTTHRGLLNQADKHESATSNDRRLDQVGSSVRQPQPMYVEIPVSALYRVPLSSRLILDRPNKNFQVSEKCPRPATADQVGYGGDELRTDNDRGGAVASRSHRAASAARW